MMDRSGTNSGSKNADTEVSREKNLLKTEGEEENTGIDEEEEGGDGIEMDSDSESRAASSVAGSFQPNPPSLPSFVEGMQVGDLPVRAREQLKYSLDVGSLGEAIKNWEWLASYFGMSWTEIKVPYKKSTCCFNQPNDCHMRWVGSLLWDGGYIVCLILYWLHMVATASVQPNHTMVPPVANAVLAGQVEQLFQFLEERVVYPKSPTLEVLWRFRKENLGRVLGLIRDKLRQYSLIMKLVLILNEEAEEKRLLPPAAAKEDPEGRSDRDSGIISSHCSSSGLHQEASRSSRSWHWEEVGRSPASEPSERPWDSPGEAGLGTSRQERDHIFHSLKKKILLTSYPDSDEHVKYVRWLERNLKKYGASVMRDDQLETDGLENVTSALERAFRQADHIVPVLSSGYGSAVELLNNGMTESGVESRAQITRYIYSQMNAEYLRNNCMNLRFRPVMFDGADGGCPAPPLFRNTLVFHWPSMHNDLFRVLFDEPRTFSREDSDNFSLASQPIQNL